MSLRRDPDQLISTWVADSVGVGGPDYLSEVLAVVERTPQKRWAKWFPGGWTVAPAKAPIVRSWMLVAALALLLLAVAAAALLAGTSRRPAFVLQGVVPLPKSADAVFASASDDALWATVGDAVLKIDPRTGTSTRFAVPNSGGTLTGALGSPNSIWVADYYGDRVVRLDRSTGDFIGDVFVGEPGGLQWQDGLWVQSGSGGGAVRIAPNGDIDLRLHDATSFVVTPGALWYVAASDGKAWAVEADPGTGAERRRIAIPPDAAQFITTDATGNPWIFARQPGWHTTRVVTVEAATGFVGRPFDLPDPVFGGIASIGNSVWALMGPASAGGSRLIELGATGPTGREEPLQDGLDPDGAVVAFGSVWIPWETKGAMYRYPVNALAP